MNNLEGIKVGELVYALNIPCEVIAVPPYTRGLGSNEITDAILVRLNGQPIYVNFDGRPRSAPYLPPIFFWDEVKIEPPQKPKRMVTKEVVRYVTRDCAHALAIGERYHPVLSDELSLTYPHKVTLTFEIEE